MRKRHWRTTVLGSIAAAALIIAAPGATIPGPAGAAIEQAIPKEIRAGAGGLAAILGALGFKVAADAKETEK